MINLIASRGLLLSSRILTLVAVIACADARSGDDRAAVAPASESSCAELQLPVAVDVAELSRLEGCRLAVAALVALLRDPDAASALAGTPASPSGFVVRRAPYLPVGSDLPASERLVVTVRLKHDRWDADVWFADSLAPLAVHLTHKPM